MQVVVNIMAVQAVLIVVIMPVGGAVGEGGAVRVGPMILVMPNPGCRDWLALSTLR
jgi:hypothetical protein